MKNTKFRSLAIFFTALFTIASFNVGWAKQIDEKAKDLLDDVSDSLKKDVDAFKDNLLAIQDYLDNYHWKGLIQDEASSGAITLKHLQLNDHPKVVVVKPGERIEGIVLCNLDREKCSTLDLYRIVLGIKGQGAQTTITEFLGGESLERFILIAPTEPGLYQVRFRLVETLFEQTALDAWKDKEGNEPDGTTTIGIIFVNS